MQSATDGLVTSLAPHDARNSAPEAPLSPLHFQSTTSCLDQGDDMTDFLVGNFAEVDKDSPNWGTKEGNFLCIAEANANADPALTTLNFHVLASKADAEAVSQYLVKEEKGESISPAIKRTYEGIIARHLVIPLLKDVQDVLRHDHPEWSAQDVIQ